MLAFLRIYPFKTIPNGGNAIFLHMNFSMCSPVRFSEDKNFNNDPALPPGSAKTSSLRHFVGCVQKELNAYIFKDLSL